MSRVSASLLPKTFRDWFKSRGWKPSEHQLDLLAKAASRALRAARGADRCGQDAGRFPAEPRRALRSGQAEAKEKRGLHTLYISPLKALATDIARNLETPVAEMGLPIRVETRTGDTPSHKRARQIERPPDILLTTPEQLALLLAHAEAREFFKDLRRVVLDELHSLVTSKRGDLLSLGLARLMTIAPQATAVGLSATVREPDDLRRYLVPQRPRPSPWRGRVAPCRSRARGWRLDSWRCRAATPSRALCARPSPFKGREVKDGRDSGKLADLVVVQGGAQPDIRMLELDERLPLAGHTASLSMPAIYELIRTHKTTLVFVNTRLQAEYTFQELWKLNDDSLAIALHHGSLDVVAAPAGRGGDGGGKAARRWSAPRPSISASTGAMWISW